MGLNTLLFAAVLALVLIAGCSQPELPEPRPVQELQSSALGSGLLAISITDEEAYGATFSAINVTIEKIELESDGAWEPFFSGQKTFNLLRLAGVKEQVVQKSVAAKKFSAIRFLVSSAQMVKTGGEILSVSVPSGLIVLQKDFEVQNGKSAEMVIEFDPYSVVMLEGNYLLQPAPMLLLLLSLDEFDQKVQALEKQRQEQETREHAVGIEQLVFPSRVDSGAQINFSWKIIGGAQGVVPHTAVHFDLSGNHGADIKEYANASEILSGQTPQVFSTQITAPPVNKDSQLFFRFHAVVDGQHHYSDELVVQVMAQKAPQQELKVLEIISDDSKFDPEEIIVGAGDLVRITFNVPTTKVSWGGEDIRSSQFNTGVIQPGNSKTVEFTAPKEGFEVKSFWPRSSVLKATMVVKIQ